jgi:hypothetical protein
MAHEILPFSIALTLGLSWMFIGIPLCFHLFGVDLPLNTRKRALVKLSFEQKFFAYGGLYWGICMLIFRITDIYVRWRLYRSPADRPTPSGFARDLVAAVLGGIVFGLITASLSSSSKATQ